MSMIPWLVVATLGLVAGDLLAVTPLPWLVLAMIMAAGTGLVLVPADGRVRRIGVALLGLALGFSNADRVYRPVHPARFPESICPAPAPGPVSRTATNRAAPATAERRLTQSHQRNQRNHVRLSGPSGDSA